MIFELLVTAAILGGGYYIYDKDRRKRKNKNLEQAKPVVTTPVVEPVAPEPVAAAPVTPAPTPEPVEPVVTRQDVSGHDVEFDINKVKWLHTNVSKWRETMKIGSASITETRTRFKNINAGNLPPVNLGLDAGGRPAIIDSNLWIFVEIKGIWYGSTFERLRPNQNDKQIGWNHIHSNTKQNPIASFPLIPGDKVYLMRSGLARNPKIKNVKERSNIVPVILK